MPPYMASGWPHGKASRSLRKHVWVCGQQPCAVACQDRLIHGATLAVYRRGSCDNGDDHLAGRPLRGTHRLHGERHIRDGYIDCIGVNPHTPFLIICFGWVAAAKILAHIPEHVPAEALIPQWLSWLPITNNPDEGVHVYGYLCTLIENNHPAIAMNLPHVVRVLAYAGV